MPAHTAPPSVTQPFASLTSGTATQLSAFHTYLLTQKESLRTLNSQHGKDLSLRNITFKYYLERFNATHHPNCIALKKTTQGTPNSAPELNVSQVTGESDDDGFAIVGGGKPTKKQNKSEQAEQKSQPKATPNTTTNNNTKGKGKGKGGKGKTSTTNDGNASTQPKFSPFDLRYPEGPPPFTAPMKMETAK